MGLMLTEEQTLLKTTAQEFIQSNSPVSALRALRDSDDKLGYSRDSWQQMIDLGWSGITFPEQYGGLDFGFVGLGSVMEEAGRSLVASPLFATIALAANVILLGGSESQKQAILPKVIAGEITLALALEESSRHCVDNIQLAAHAVDGGFELKGDKTFVLDGHSADKLLVVARTSGEAGRRDGLSVFLVDSNAKGIECRRTKLVDSRNCANISFNHVRVDAGDLVGELHQGIDCLEPALDRARILLAAEMLGGIQVCFDATVAYLKEREQFGVKIGTFQALKHRASKMFAEIELCKAAVQAALTAIDDTPESVPTLASLVKARVNNVALLVTNEAVQMHGGIGVTDELDIGLYLKRMRVAVQVLGDSHFHTDRFASLNGY